MLNRAPYWMRNLRAKGARSTETQPFISAKYYNLIDPFKKLSCDPLGEVDMAHYED